MEVQISSGTVTLRKPNAGARNKAAIAANKDGQINQMLLMVELLPYCIQSHPWGQVPVKQALDSLEIEEYDKILSALGELMNPEEVKKNAE